MYVAICFWILSKRVICVHFHFPDKMLYLCIVILCVEMYQSYNGIISNILFASRILKQLFTVPNGWQ